MVDITERLEKIRDMIYKGGYFVINRGHQYGKTTTLNALETFLTPEYLVINLDFQLLSNTDFSTEGRFVSAFAREMWNCQEMCSRGIPKILDRQISGSVMSQPC